MAVLNVVVSLALIGAALYAATLVMLLAALAIKNLCQKARGRKK